MTPASSERMGAASIPEIAREEIQARRRDASLALVDVRPREAYEAGHLPNAISMPLDEIAERARLMWPDTQQEIAIYCGGYT